MTVRCLLKPGENNFICGFKDTLSFTFIKEENVDADFLTVQGMRPM